LKRIFASRFEHRFAQLFSAKLKWTIYFLLSPQKGLFKHFKEFSNFKHLLLSLGPMNSPHFEISVNKGISLPARKKNTTRKTAFSSLLQKICQRVSKKRLASASRKDE